VAVSAVVAAFAAGLAEGEGADAAAGLLGAGAGEFAATGLVEVAGEVAALAAGEVAGDKPGEVAGFGCGAFGAGELAATGLVGDAAGEVAAAFGGGAFGAGEVPGEVDGAGPVLDGEGDGVPWSSAGARLPMFERSGPSLILPSKAGRSKI
jgi:hypothetical protein